MLPQVPVLVGLSTGDGTSTELLDLRVLDFLNHPLGAGVAAPLTAEILRCQLPVFFRWMAGRGIQGAPDAVWTG